MAQKWLIIGFLLCFCLMAPGCKNYEKENKHLKDEVRMLREENDYHKAEIVGLKKELAELSAKVLEEQAQLRRQFEEERAELQKKLQEEREAMHKKAQEAAKKKKNGVAKTEAKAPVPMKPVTVKKETKEGAAPKATQPHSDGSKTQVPKTSSQQ
jgi:gas vesicle protein